MARELIHPKHNAQTSLETLEEGFILGMPIWHPILHLPSLETQDSIENQKKLMINPNGDHSNA